MHYFILTNEFNLPIVEEKTNTTQMLNKISSEYIYVHTFVIYQETFRLYFHHKEIESCGNKMPVSTVIITYVNNIFKEKINKNASSYQIILFLFLRFNK